MRKLGLVTALIFASYSIGFSQQSPAKTSSPNLSGTWVLEKVLPELTLNGKRVKASDETLVISQNDLELVIVEDDASNNTQVKRSIIADGRRIPYNNFPVDDEHHVTYRWKGKKLIKEIRYVMGKGSLIGERPITQSAKMLSREEWALSKGGKLLTRIISPALAPGFEPPMNLEIQKIYRKKD